MQSVFEEHLRFCIMLIGFGSESAGESRVTASVSNIINWCEIRFCTVMIPIEL